MKQYIMATVVVMAMILPGCGKNDQDKIVTEFCRALDAGRLDEALSYMSHNAQIELEKKGGKALLATATEQLRQHRGIKSLKVTAKESVGKDILLSVVYKLNDGTEMFDKIPVTKEGSSWKIAK